MRAESFFTYESYIRLSSLQFHVVGEVDGGLDVPRHRRLIDRQRAAESGAEFVDDQGGCSCGCAWREMRGLREIGGRGTKVRGWVGIEVDRGRGEVCRVRARARTG